MKIIKYMPIFLAMVIFCTLLPMSRGGRIGGIGSNAGGLGVARSGNFQRGGGAPSGLAQGPTYANKARSW